MAGNVLDIVRFYFPPSDITQIGLTCRTGQLGSLLTWCVDPDISRSEFIVLGDLKSYYKVT